MQCPAIKKFKNSAHDTLSFRYMKSTAEVTANFLQPGGHAILLCTAQQLVVWQRRYSAHKLTQDDSFSLSFASTSRGKFTVSAAFFTFENDPSHHRNNVPSCREVLHSCDSGGVCAACERMDSFFPLMRMW